MNNISKEQTLSDEIYEQQSFSFKYKLILFSFFIFLGLMIAPWGNILKIPSLSSLIGCPVQHSEPSVNFFPPGPKFKSLTLPTSCTGLKQNVTIKDFSIGIGGISFSPFGPVLNAQGQLDDLPLKIKIALGLGQQTISIYEEKLSLTKLNNVLKKYIQLPFIFHGTAKADIRVSLNNNSLDEYRLDLSSADLQIPAQMITILQTPDLPLKVLNLKFQGKKNKASLDNFILGNSSSLLLQSKGNILFDFYFIQNSQLDLEVELKLSQKLNQDFSILSAILGNQKVSEGHYKMKVKGTLASPVF